MIRYTCRQCGAKLESSESLAGKLDKCPMCGYECPVPSPKPQGLAGETLAGDERGTLDPEALADWVIIGLYHAENIIRKLGKLKRRAWTKAMQAEGPELKPAELLKIWGGMMDQAGDKLRQIAVEAGNDLRAQRKEHNMGKWTRKVIAGVGAALDAWRWRLITLSILIFALSFAVWVFTPAAGRYQLQHDGGYLTDTRTGTVYLHNYSDQWETVFTFPGGPTTKPTR